MCYTKGTWYTEEILKKHKNHKPIVVANTVLLIAISIVDTHYLAKYTI